jgi:phosphoheptose isomerase
MKEFIESEFRNISCNFINLQALSPQIEKVSDICIEALKNGHKIMFCGNGGSAADSQHLAAELVGRYKINRPAMNALALTVDTSILTAVGNDYGYDTIFERQVEGIGKSGDVLIGLSTSGNSKNVLAAFELAKKMGILTVAMTGHSGGKMKELADYAINVPSDVTNNIQEMHIAVGHLLCGVIENELNA